MDATRDQDVVVIYAYIIRLLITQSFIQDFNVEPIGVCVCVCVCVCMCVMVQFLSIIILTKLYRDIIKS